MLKDFKNIYKDCKDMSEEEFMNHISKNYPQYAFSKKERYNEYKASYINVGKTMRSTFFNSVKNIACKLKTAVVEAKRDYDKVATEEGLVLMEKVANVYDEDFLEDVKDKAKVGAITLGIGLVIGGAIALLNAKK